MSFFDEIRYNQLKSYALVIFFITIVLVVGGGVGYYYTAGAPGGWMGGVVIAFLVASLYALFTWFAGANMILGLMGAKEVTKKEYPHLFHTVEGLAIAAGLPKPKCYVINDSALNAFATGRDPAHSAICVTSGLLKKLNREELEGVIAHEMSHIKNYDIRIMMLAAVLVGVLTLVSDFILRSFLFGGGRRDDNGANWIFIAIGFALAILSPVIGHLIKLAISRRREYLADATGAMLTRYPKGLANALRKISHDPDPLVDRANKATAHLFISTPFRKKSGFLTRAFATHPPIEDRIARLEKM